MARVMPMKAVCSEQPPPAKWWKRRPTAAKATP